MRVFLDQWSLKETFQPNVFRLVLSVNLDSSGNYRYPRKSRDESPDVRKITQSDALGYFDIPVELANTQEWFIFQHPDYARVIRQLDLRGDRLPELTVILTQGGQVEGYLYDWQGHTLAQTPLHVMDESQYFYWKYNLGRLDRITTDANGFFHIGHLPEEICHIFREDPEQQLGTVQISILPSQGQTRTLNINGPWQAIPRQNQNDPFVFNNLPPGQFKILAQCIGYPSIRQAFEILPGQETQSVNLVFPTGSASLTGQITLVHAAKYPSHVTLCNRDQTVVESLPVGVDGGFSMKHLPAGNYTLVRSSVISTDRSDPLGQIQLTPGEHKTIDLLYSDDASADSYDGYLVILVVNEQGLPIVTPDVWLEQEGRTIEAHMSTDKRKWFRGHPGRYLLHVQYPGFEPIQTSIEMKGKRDRTTQEILEPLVVVMKQPKTAY